MVSSDGEELLLSLSRALSGAACTGVAESHSLRVILVRGEGGLGLIHLAYNECPGSNTLISGPVYWIPRAYLGLLLSARVSLRSHELKQGTGYGRSTDSRFYPDNWRITETPAITSNHHIVEGLSETGAKDVIESDRAVVRVMPEQLTQIPKEMDLLSSTRYQQDIAKFLGNWVTVGSGTIDSTTTGQFFSLPLPDSFIDNDAIARKLEGYQGFKGTFRVKFLTNANVFQQGRILINFIPCAAVGGFTSNEARLGNLTLKTQLPRVEMDISAESEVEFDVPYLAPAAFYNLIENSPDWGTIFFSIYSPLKYGSGGSTTFTYTVLVSMEPSSLELYNPTSMMVPLSALAKLRAARRPMRPSMQGVKKKKKRAAPEAEADSAGRKPISEALGLLSKAAGVVSVVAPPLTAVAGGVAWALAIASKAASAFGYSKPRDETPVTRVITTPLIYNNNPDAVDHSQSLALFNGNKVECLPGFAGTDVDEMSLDYLLQKSYYTAAVNWTGAMAQGHQLYLDGTAPQDFVVIDSSPFLPVYSAGPLGYFSYFFGAYHGSVKFTFKLVKTDMHQGRLLVAFFPGVAAPISYANTIYCHREYIDISKGTEFSFVFPYTDEAPYKLVDQGYGRIVVYVVNELTGPSTVADNIDILIEVGAAPGFEYAMPVTNNIQPVFEVTEPKLSARVKMLLEAEGKEMRPSSNPIPAKQARTTISSGPVGGSIEIPSELKLATKCIGERVLSVKQLMLGSTEVWLSGVLLGSRVRPFTFGIGEISSTDMVSADCTGDAWTQFGTMYAFYRGGCVWRQVFQGNTTAFKTHFVFDSSGGAAYELVGADVEMCHKRVVFADLTSKVTSTQFPFYNRSWCRLVRGSTTQGASGTPEPSDYMGQEVFMYTESGGTVGGTNTYLRQASDDAQFGFFLGVLPFVRDPPATVAERVRNQVAKRDSKAHNSITAPTISSVKASSIPQWSGRSPITVKENAGVSNSSYMEERGDKPANRP
jgi:hypothetical protein